MSLFYLDFQNLNINMCRNPENTHTLKFSSANGRIKNQI